MKQIAIGEVVRLRSGGPKMTVMWLPDPEYGSGYGCSWFCSESERKTEEFPGAALEIVPGE
jgi:uncharacterized protein YodC (DUF2158 family)